MNRKIDSDLLIHMKRLSGLTIEAIAKGAGVPLGTAQKIFSGITANPRPAAAQALYEYLLPFAQSQKQLLDPIPYRYVFPAEQTPHADSSGILREGREYGGGKKQPEKGILNPSEYIEGNLARKMRGPGQYTIDDYRALPDDQRVELIDGFFFDLASPSLTHQRISGKLFNSFYNYIRQKGGTCEVFSAPLDVQLDCDEKTMVQPDILVVCDPSRVREWGLYGAPDLAIEIASPASLRKDRTLKMTKYGEAGVREYWLVDPEREQVTVCRFDEDMPVSFYPFTAAIPVGIYGGDLTICLKEES